MINGMPDGPAYMAYEELNAPEAEAFFFQCLETLQEEYGPPEIPVNKVIFRRSKKTEEASRYRIAEDFSRTQCIDVTNGVFVVYIGADPKHRDFYPLLTHECGHFINAHIMDWYMEGFATLFSEEVCAKYGKEWGSWERHFNRSRKHPYARSYRMMRDLKAASPGAFPSLIRCVEPNAQNPEWLQIDVDAWLDKLDDDQYYEALDIIEPHLKLLKKYDQVYYTVKVPAGLK